MPEPTPLTSPLSQRPAGMRRMDDPINYPMVRRLRDAGFSDNTIERTLAEPEQQGSPPLQAFGEMAGGHRPVGPTPESIWGPGGTGRGGYPVGEMWQDFRQLGSDLGESIMGPRPPAAPPMPQQRPPMAPGNVGDMAPIQGGQLVQPAPTAVPLQSDPTAFDKGLSDFANALNLGPVTMPDGRTPVISYDLLPEQAATPAPPGGIVPDTGQSFWENPEFAQMLTEFGLATLAAGGQEGATWAGSIGQGGLHALAGAERRKAAKATGEEKRQKQDLERRRVAVQEARVKIEREQARKDPIRSIKQVGDRWVGFTEAGKQKDLAAASTELNPKDHLQLAMDLATVEEVDEFGDKVTNVDPVRFRTAYAELQRLIGGGARSEGGAETVPASAAEAGQPAGGQSFLATKPVRLSDGTMVQPGEFVIRTPDGRLMRRGG